LMPFIYMTAAVGIVMMWRALSELIVRGVSRTHIVRVTSAIVVAAIFLIAPAVGTMNYLIHSHPSLYVNALGGNRIGYFFPHDEFYDLGARESIKFIAETAQPGATMASEIPGVVQYYLERYNRTDMRSQILPQLDPTLPEPYPDFVMIQPGRVYVENL